MNRSTIFVITASAGALSLIAMLGKSGPSNKKDDGDAEESLEERFEHAKDELEIKAKDLSLEEQRIARMIDAASEKAPPEIAKYIKAAAPYMGWTVVIGEGVLWVQFKSFQLGWRVYQSLPINLAKAVTGLAICFFGGSFPTLITASEAFTQSGWAQTKKCVRELYEEGMLAVEASKEDDQKDDDGDGIKDVNQVSGQALLTRKSLLVLRTVDPEKISKALAGVAVSWTAVAAVLKVEFARTISLGVSIADRLKAPTGRVMIPVLTHVLPPEYHRWIPVTIDYLCKYVGVSVAWKLQSAISAFHSSFRGGLMFTRAVLTFAGEKGLTNVRHEDTMIDEFTGWPLAAAGFWCQLKGGFELHFPFNFVLWPLEAAEKWIQWQITAGPDASVAK